MRNDAYYLRKYTVIINLLCILLIIPSVVYSQSPSIFGDFPFENSFLSTTRPQYITVASGDNTVKFTMDGIQLTENYTHRFGGVFFNDRKFSPVNGIIVEFEYMMYNGGADGGDGLNMFLFDANFTTDPKIGAAGAAIGYNYNSGAGSGKRKGLSGAYLGVAFDAFGNHKQLRFEKGSTETGVPGSEQAGIPFRGTAHSNTMEGAVDAAYNGRNDVVLRGIRCDKELRAYRELTGEWRTLEVGYSGYPVLISQSTYTGKGVIKKDDQSGDYVPISPDYSGTRFKISGNGRFTDSSSPSYRRAIVELFPARKEDGGGFYITVSIKHNNGTDVIIRDYHYKEKFYYKENIMLYSRYSGALDDKQPTFELDAKVPDYLRIGFAASTGASTNIHVIKNVNIKLPRAAEAYNDSININPSQTAQLQPLVNDIAYNGIISKVQTGSSANIDPNTFRFIDNNTIVAVNPGDPYIEHTVSNQGVWRYYPSTQQVTFIPVPEFVGEAKIEYDIKGKKDNTPQAGPYEDEAYRSLHAELVVNIEESPLEPERILISNEMVTSRPRK